MLSEEEKKQLMNELDDLTGAEKVINQKVVELASQQNQIEEELNNLQDGIV
jgi:prefoldin subunit 5